MFMPYQNPLLLRCKKSCKSVVYTCLQLIYTMALLKC